MWKVSAGHRIYCNDHNQKPNCSTVLFNLFGSSNNPVNRKSRNQNSHIKHPNRSANQVQSNRHRWDIEQTWEEMEGFACLEILGNTSLIIHRTVYRRFWSEQSKVITVWDDWNSLWDFMHILNFYFYFTIVLVSSLYFKPKGGWTFLA